MLKLYKIVVDSIQGYFHEELTASQMGFAVQEDQVERLLRRFAGFATVEVTDLHGRPLSLPLNKGPDGGLDLILNIAARNEHGAAIVFGRVKKILLTNDY